MTGSLSHDDLWQDDCKSKACDIHSSGATHVCVWKSSVSRCHYWGLYEPTMRLFQRRYDDWVDANYTIEPFKSLVCVMQITRLGPLKHTIGLILLCVGHKTMVYYITYVGRPNHVLTPSNSFFFFGGGHLHHTLGPSNPYTSIIWITHSRNINHTTGAPWIT